MKRKLLSVLLTLCLAFSLLPTAALADEENVAKVGETAKYTTLAAALDAAQNGATVTLLADVTEDVAIKKSITLDLGGKTLTGKGTANTATLTIAKGATATVKNGTVKGTANAYYNIQNNGTATFEDVTATAGNTGSSMIDNWGTLTITSGDYTGGLNVVKSEEGSTLTINGGKFTLDYATNGYTGVIFAYGTTTISGGEFIQSLTTTGRWNHPQVVATGVVEGCPAITKITGGTFTNNISGEGIFRGVGKGTSDNFEVSGGTFNRSVSDGFFKDGYFAMKNAGGTYDAAGPFAARVNSTAGYSTLAEAIAAAKAGDTVTLLTDVEVSEPITVNTAITLDLGGKTLTSTWAMQSNAAGAARYALVNNAKMKLTNGTFNVGQARGVGAYAGLTLSGITVTQELTGGHACVAFCKEGQPYTIKNSTINGAYAVCNFANNATITISGSELNGTGNTLYHNGNNYGLKLTVKNTTVTSSGRCGVYISGSTSAQSNAANRNGAGGYQKADFTGCTISGAMNGVEVKYTDLTLNGCKVSSTATGEPSYSQDNNGPAASGFAVVSTDNAMNGATPKPEGTITITGSGKYNGPVGLGSLESVKTEFKDFTDDTIKISGGTFSNAVLPEYCAPGFVPKANDDGTYTVEEHKPVEYWTGFTADTKIGKTFATLDEAMAYAAKQTDASKRVVIAGDYTLTKDTSIPENVYVDVMGKLIIPAGVTMTVPANAKRLGAWTGGTIEGEGMVLIEGRGNDFGESKVMINGTMSTDMLIVPEGYILAKNSNSYFAAKTLFEITYSDGKVEKSGKDMNLTDATKVKLLEDVTDFARSFGSTDKLSDNFVLDLGGHTLTGKNTVTADVLKTSVPMTITNGTIKYASTDVKHSALVTSADVTIAATAVIDGGRGYGIEVDGYAGHTLIVNGTVKSDGDYAITGNGREEVGGIIRDCNITVNAGATISAPNGVAIYHPEKGTVTINGGTINGATGVQMCSGELFVNGGTITATATTKVIGNDGGIVDGAAISIINRSYPGGTPTAEITKGTFNSARGIAAVQAYTVSGTDKTNWTGAGNYVNISGGTFSSIPDNMNALCAAGYIPFKNADGTYGVTRPSSGSSGSYDPTYSVSTPSKTEHGTVTVSPKSASKGDTVTVTVKPDSGYVLETLTVTDKNGNELTLKDKGNGKYAFTMPSGKVEVKATFMEDNSMLNFFYDVPNDAYFYEAVKWAVKNGITTGVGNDLFAPEQPCTRAQIVTFLWRAAGSPEPKGAASGMTDVVSGSYYEKAVAWAIENGITTGTTTSTFSPDATCTRAQAVTFLARALSAKASGKAEFSDVPADSYFADAVAWAAANGVTEGIGGGLFGSDNDCTRGQIVTFLYRAYNK